MKSKKLNLEIINNFIDQCIANDICTPDQILNEAKNQISNIDLEMSKLLKLKNKKLELLEVVNFLSEFNQEKNKFSLLKNTQEIKNICNKIKKNENINDANKNLIKKLLDYQILSVKDGKFILGKEYEKYELSTKNG